MLINGEKWACETCIKGHRATHCKHTDRKLVVIKKKGRPSTQCERCRELRVIRQLHVKCDCEDQGTRITKKKKETNSINSSTAAASTTTAKKKIKVDILRLIAPKQENTTTKTTKTKTPPPPLDISATPSPVISSSCCSSKKTSISSHTTIESNVTQSNVSCSSSNTTTPPPPSTIPIPLESVPLPDIPPPSSCCGPPSKNQQGKTIRVVTCRCGDACACIGCDAHPSRAMKEGAKDDVYIGFDSSNKLNMGQDRKLSITTNTNNKSSQQQQDHPTSILSQDGILLCGCGCQKTYEDCSGCSFGELCCQSF